MPRRHVLRYRKRAHEQRVPLPRRHREPPADDDKAQRKLTAPSLDRPRRGCAEVVLAPERARRGPSVDSLTVVVASLRSPTPRKYSAWHRANSSDSCDCASRSRAYSLIVSSMEKRSPERRTRLFSTSDWSSVDVGFCYLLRRLERQPPTKMARQAKRRLSSPPGLVAPLDRGVHGSLTLRRVVRSTGEKGQALLGRSRSCVGGSAFVRTAASSTASGRQSSRRQISRTASSGSATAARSRKRPTASSSASGGTAYSMFSHEVEPLTAGDEHI